MNFLFVLFFQLAVPLATAFDDPYSDGVRLIEEGKLQQAVARLQLAVKQTPAKAQPWKALGVAYAMAGDYTAAEQPFENACGLDKKLPDACYFWARALYALNKFESAIRILKLEEPQTGRTFTAMGQSLEALGNNQQAEKEFQKALAAKDSAGEARLRYGIFLFRSGRISESADMLETSLKLLNRSSEAAAELGRVRYQQGNLADAERLLRMALSWEPGREAAKLLLEKVEKLQGLK